MIKIKLATLGFAFIMLSLVYIEKKRYKKIITPYSVTAIPFVIIAMITNFFLIQLDFYPVTLRVLFFLFIQLIILWITGYFVSTFFNLGMLTTNNNYSATTNEFKDYSLILIMISWVTILLVFRKVMALFSTHGGWTYFGNPDYEKEMSIGLAAHVIHFGRVCFIFLVFIYSKSKYKKLVILTLLGLFISIAIFQLKYLILYLILITFFFYNMEKPEKKQLKNLALSAIVLLLLFNLFWVSLTVAWGTFGFTRETMWQFFAKQTANYLATGPIFLDKWMNHPNVRPDWVLVIIFKNFYNMIVGNPVRYDFVPLVSLGFIKAGPNIYSNVGTAYGTFFIIGGWPLTLAYSIVTSVIYYVVFFYSFVKYKFYLTFLTLFFLAMATLTFFGQYFTSLSTYEMPLLFFIMGSIFRTINFLKLKLRSFG